MYHSIKEDKYSSEMRSSSRNSEGKDQTDRPKAQKMSSFGRKVKADYEYKNPDVQKEVPSYQRQTCASLTKRKTVKCKTLPESLQDKSLTTKKKLSSHTKKTNKHSRKESKDSDLSDNLHVDVEIAQDELCEIYNDVSTDEESGSEKDNGLSTPSPEPWIPRTCTSLDEPYTATLVSDFVEECFENAISKLNLQETTECVNEPKSNFTQAAEKESLANAFDSTDLEPYANAICADYIENLRFTTKLDDLRTKDDQEQKDDEDFDKLMEVSRPESPFVLIQSTEPRGLSVQAPVERLESHQLTDLFTEFDDIESDYDSDSELLEMTETHIVSPIDSELTEVSTTLPKDEETSHKIPTDGIFRTIGTNFVAGVIGVGLFIFGGAIVPDVDSSKSSNEPMHQENWMSRFDHDDAFFQHRHS